MDTAIQKFSGFEMFDARASIVTAHMTWPLKMDILAALVEQLRKQSAHLAKFDDIKPRLKKAQDGRNRIVHAFWGYEEGEASIARLTARGQLKTSTQVVTVADIDRVVDDIGRATAAMIKLVLNK